MAGNYNNQNNCGGSAADAPAADARPKLAQVEKAFVCSGAIDIYTGQLARFILHVFDNNKEHLVAERLMEMEKADEYDKAHNNPKRRTKLRAFILEAITKFQAKRDNQHHNCVLKIEDEEDALSFETVVNYMDTKFDMVEVERGCAEAYLNAVHGTCEITPDMLLEGSKVRVKVYRSESHYACIRGALVWMYKTCRIVMPYAQELSLYLTGMSRCVAAAKQSLGLKLMKGKADMKQEVPTTRVASS